VRIMHAAQDSPAWRWRRPAGQTSTDVAGGRPRNPHDRQRGSPGRGGGRENRIGPTRHMPFALHTPDQRRAAGRLCSGVRSATKFCVAGLPGAIGIYIEGKYGDQITVGLRGRTPRTRAG
jgi:hypothetical protein